MRSLLCLAAIAAFASPARSQTVALNEIYARASGQQFLEIEGPAGMVLSNYMILSVEGDQPICGILDRAWDLTGLVIPDDGGGRGFIVIGDAAVPNVDRVVTPLALLEPGTQTIYLVSVGSVSSVIALLNMQVTNGFMLTIAGVTIVDAVCITDGTPGDDAFDNAPVLGPVGSAIPPGIFRPGDNPNRWCMNYFLDGDVAANANLPRTPGVTNYPVCGPPAPGTATCFGVGCPCGNDSATTGCVNSTGSGAVLSGSGSTSVAADDLVLTATGFPANNTGLFFMGGSVFSPVNVGDGLACTGGIFRYFPGMVDGSGMFSQSTPVASAQPGQILAGDTRHFQAWTRDVLCGPPPAPCVSPCGNNSNLSNAYSVTFTP